MQTRASTEVGPLRFLLLMLIPCNLHEEIRTPRSFGQRSAECGFNASQSVGFIAVPGCAKMGKDIE